MKAYRPTLRLILTTALTVSVHLSLPGCSGGETPDDDDASSESPGPTVTPPGDDDTEGTPAGETPVDPGDDDTTPAATPTATPTPVNQLVMVGYAEGVVAFEAATGRKRPGQIEPMGGNGDLLALESGVVGMNLSTADQVVFFDSRTMTELARMPSSGMGGVHPSYAYLAPPRNGHHYWMTLNRGDGHLETNSALFIDVDPASPTFLEPVGEIPLGLNKHWASFSATQERVVISNATDCNNVLSVYDFSDISDIRTLETLTAVEAGWDGSSYEKTCDDMRENGMPLVPYGCATSRLTGRAWCMLAYSAHLIVVDIDAPVPTFRVMETGTSGPGHITTSADGAWIFTAQSHPREGEEGAVDCQIGQLLVADAQSETVVKEMPLLYRGPECNRPLEGTPDASAEPFDILQSHDETLLFIGVAGAMHDSEARVSQEIVVDISNPAEPVQLESIRVGTSSGHHSQTLSGDGKYLFVTNSLDGTVSRIDTATLSVSATWRVGSTPVQVATWGSEEGPGYQKGLLE